jgi:chorismate mutase
MVMVTPQPTPQPTPQHETRDSLASTRQAAPAVMLRALRGATTVPADEPATVAGAVRELVEALTRANDLAPDDVLSAIFSATPDLHSLYPAAAAREVGWQDVPMLCVTEMDVAGAPARCVRVLLHLAVARERGLRPVYLHGARVLRPDLVGRA